MKSAITFNIAMALLLTQPAIGQDCKTNADLDATPGKYLTAAQYPWPAARAEYFNGMTTAADKAMAKKTLNDLEKIEQQSHTSFNLTGGDWENYYSTDGYEYCGNTRLGKSTFQSSLHEYFCYKGKLKRNDEAGTILRMYVNSLPLNTLDRFLHTPFGSSMGNYDFGLQYQDWKNHQPSNVNAQLISLFTYMTCSNPALMEAINSGNNYFQDVPEKDIRPNNRNNYVYRYWFMKKKNLPVLVPVTRKEYLQSLLEYYDREKLHFPKLLAKLTADHDAGIKQYSSWEADVTDKISVVKKALMEHNEEWLSAQAVINHSEDNTQTYKARLAEKTNYNRFWKFYDKEKNEGPLYKYNSEYFKVAAASPASPQMITIAFRYVSIPSSLRVLNNFSNHFDFKALQHLVE